MARLTVVARIRVKKGSEDAGKEALSWLLPRSRKDKGCLQYDLHQGLEDKANFVFFERWESKADLDAHIEMPFMKEFMEKNRNIFDGPSDVSLWEDV